MNNGWIKIDRNILNWRWYTTPYTKALFIHLLLIANFEDRDYKDITIHRGEVLTTQARLAEDLRLTRQQVRTALEHLNSTKEITITKRGKYTVISIPNYDYYQSNQPQEQPVNNQQTTKKQPKNNQQYIRNKEFKEGEEYIYTAESVPIGITIPLKNGEYEITQSDLDRFLEAYPNIDVKQELKKAAVWSESNPQSRKTRVGVKKFLNGWLGRAKPEQPKKKSWLEIAEEIENERKGNGGDI